MHDQPADRVATTAELRGLVQQAINLSGDGEPRAWFKRALAAAIQLLELAERRQGTP